MISPKNPPNKGYSVTDEELEWLMNRAKSMNSVVEIGCFAGRSTYGLRSVCPVIYTVDNFSEGQNENTFGQFEKNVLEEFPDVHLLKMDSVDAAKKFKEKSVDMVFIDGNHQYGSIKQDIEIWLPISRKLICGHDYNKSYKDVVRAVDETFGNKIKIIENMWYVELT